MNCSPSVPRPSTRARAPRPTTRGGAARRGGGRRRGGRRGGGRASEKKNRSPTSSATLTRTTRTPSSSPPARDDDDDDDDSWGGDGGDGGYDPAASGRAERLLDKRFAQLMQEYDDDEIGELDQDDPSVLGDAPIEVRAPLTRARAARPTRARWPPAAARPPGVTRTITTQPTAGLRSNPTIET